jgi:hypothetical protein
MRRVACLLTYLIKKGIGDLERVVLLVKALQGGPQLPLSTLCVQLNVAFHPCR